MKKLVSILLCTVLIALSLASCGSSPVVKLDPVALSQGCSVRILSFNIRYAGEGDTSVRTRAPLLMGALQAYRPDSFGIQEGTPKWMRLLDDGMEEYAYVGVGRDDGKKKGEYCALFYLKDKYEVTQSDTFWLSETPDQPSQDWDSACKRICTWAVLKNKETGASYAHLNTHLDHVSEEARQKGAALVLEKAQALAAEMPVVVTGDFNQDEDSEVYRMMTSDGLGDTKYMADATMSGGTFHNYDDSSIADQSPIDYIFVSQSNVAPVQYRIIDEKVNGLYLSDHYGLMADLNFTQ